MQKNKALLVVLFLCSLTSIIFADSLQDLELEDSIQNNELVTRGLKSKRFCNLSVLRCLRAKNLRVTGNLVVENISILGKINNQPTKILYVDKNSTAPGTPDGSFFNPFLTIQDAINQIAANQDNNVNPYRIEVAPGTYTESLSFNNPFLYSIALFGHSQVTLQTASGPLISSTSNNTQLTDLNFDSFILNAPTGTGIVYTASQPFLTGNIGAQFQNCAINSTVTATNIETLTIFDSLCTGTLTLTNVTEALFFGGEGHLGADLNLVASNINYESTSFEQGHVAVDATSFIQVQNSLFTDFESSITNNGRIDAFASYLGGFPFVNNGTLNFYNSTYTPGVITGAGTINGPLIFEPYIPGNPGSWTGTPPNNVQAALDRIAAHVGPIP